MYLSDFEIQHPPYFVEQEEGLDLLASLHAKCCSNETTLEELQEKVQKVCCKKEKISRRNVVIPQHLRESWDSFGGFGDKGRFFQAFVEDVFRRFYPENCPPPDDLIHVTCTGYCSPSAAQKIVLERHWEEKTTVTHAYHMGCMGALPAIRMALGFAKLDKPRIDIVHTELCSIHLNPALHTSEQLVAQSLFGDGLIKYTLHASKPKKSAFQVLTVYEQLIPNTEEKMKWECEDWGLKMTLSKDIPLLIARSIQSFVQTLEKRTSLSLGEAFYAIHPGGPKIIEMIAKKLDLSKNQLATSEKILYNYGNISSATLPHVWEEMLNDEEVPIGSHIVGLAFGPGLCMSGTVLQKV